MRVCVVGCAHGEIDAMFEAVAETERKMRQMDEAAFRPVDLVICCGDFQACRSQGDLATMACPPKYRDMHTFHEYYHGQKRAPRLTLFVGGNHEASNHLQELPYGGWVAPNVYYLGHSGVVRVGKELIVAGLSGIYKENDYGRGRFERAPFDERSMRSVFHVKRHDVARLEMLPRTKRLDVFVSHDWPSSIACAHTQDQPQVVQLIRRKPFFAEEIRRNELGSPVNAHLLALLRPRHWFAAHLHVKFAVKFSHGESPSLNARVDPPVKDDAEIDLDDTESSDPASLIKAVPGGQTNEATHDDSAMDKRARTGLEDATRFLCLDKIVPGRDFMQIVDVGETDEKNDGIPSLYLDRDWLAIIKATHDLTPTEMRPSRSRCDLEGAQLEAARAFVSSAFPTDDALRVDETSFVRTVTDVRSNSRSLQGNPQLDNLLAKLKLEHLTTVPFTPARAS